MKTEKILAMIYQAAEQLPEEARGAYQYARENPDLYDVLPDLGATLGALAHQLEEEATREAAKRCGRAAQHKALERVVKSALDSQPSRPSCHGSIPARDGARAVCDGYRAVRITNPDAKTPRAIPDGVAPLDVDGFFWGLDSRAASYPVSLPSAAELRVMLETGRQEYRARTGKPGTKYQALYMLDAGPFVVYVNAQYLLDMLEALPGAVCAAGRGPYDALYFTAPDGDGLLLPVNRSRAKNLPVINQGTNAGQKTA